MTMFDGNLTLDLGTMTTTLEDYSIHGPDLTLAGTSWPSSSTITIGAQGSSTGYSYSSSYTTNPGTWSSITPHAVNIHSKGIDLTEDADIRIGEHSLRTFMETLESRLAILQPDPEKLEKFAALKAAYEHYKLLEALCSEPIPRGPDDE